MIAHLHTPEVGGFIIGTDHIPRIGEKIRVPPIDEVPDERDGWYLVEDVVYTIPSNPGHQRVDIYAREVITPADLSYSERQKAMYQSELLLLKRR